MSRLSPDEGAELLGRVAGLVGRAAQEERQRCLRHCQQRMELWSTTAQARSEHTAARDQARFRANEAECIRDLIEDEVTGN
ncbi:MAG TPA: hypothetical protein VMF89_14865 [Polyangiales bacterium]|nr:hypothetical protein [Polyangiales bacterium]